MISYDCAQQGTRSTSARPHQPTSRTRLYRTTFPWFPRPAPQHVISSPFNVLPTLPQVYAAPIPPQPIILYLYAAIHRTSNVAHMTSSKSSPPQCSQRGERRLYPMTVWSTATKVRPILTLRHVDSNMRSDFGGATSGQRFKTSAPRSGRPLFQRWSTAVRGAGLFVALGTSTCSRGEANCTEVVLYELCLFPLTLHRHCYYCTCTMVSIVIVRVSQCANCRC